MKIYAPKYYTQFKCISSNCTHSCCIGWEIDVDKATLEKYSNLTDAYGKGISKSIKGKRSPHFKLLKGGRCAHLDKKGLCNIIKNLGKEYLCDICREHPRFYNQTINGLEVGLGLSCLEACRLILSSNDYNEIIQVGEYSIEAEFLDFNPIIYRDEAFSILTDKIPYKEKLEALKSRFKVSPQSFTDKEWVKLLKDLEYLEKPHKKLFANYSSTKRLPQNEVYLERALAYFIYRYVAKANSSYEVGAYVGLCLFLESLLSYVLSSQNACELNEIIPLAVTLSEEIEYSESNVDKILDKFL